MKNVMIVQKVYALNVIKLGKIYQIAICLILDIMIMDKIVHFFLNVIFYV